MISEKPRLWDDYSPEEKARLQELALKEKVEIYRQRKAKWSERAMTHTYGDWTPEEVAE